jgi:RNA recognition motif-containing protein
MSIPFIKFLKSLKCVFSVFSADEDARQAMMMSGSVLKGTRVSLNLSSRAEMQKVIETARNQVSQAFMLNQGKQIQQQAPTPVAPPAAMIASQFAKRNQEINNPVLTTPNPLANFFAKQKTQQQNFAPSYSTQNTYQQQQNFNNDPRSIRSRSPIDESNGKKVKKSRFSSADDKVPVVPVAANLAILQLQKNLQQNLQQSLSRNQYQQQPTILPIQQQQQQYKPQTTNNAIWDQPPPFQNYDKQPTIIMNGMSSIQNSTIIPARNHYQTENSSSGGNDTISDIGLCVKVSNVSKETTYDDLAKFFMQLNITDYKFLTDNRGNRSGVVLIRFASSDAKKKALTRNMWQLGSTQVLIMSITEDDFESGLMNSKPKRNDDRYRERSNSNERDFRSNTRFNDNRGNNNYNNNFNNRGGGGGDNNRNNRSNFRNNENQYNEDKQPEFPPDTLFTVLMIDDIPRTANEPDICEAFPNIVSITIDRYTAYVKFASHEIAKSVNENRFIHYIKNKRVFIEPSSDAMFNDLVRRFGKYDNPDCDGNNGPDVFNDQSNDSNNSSQKRSFESRDPRQRNQSNNGNNVNNNFNNQQLRSDCVIIKGMEANTNIDDVENFFRDLQIYKMRVHILLDKRGNPCGDCFVEFKYPNDAPKACNKNNSFLNGRKVTVMMIPREQVEAVLNSFAPNSTGYGNRDEGRNQPNNNANRWAPPNDFGDPGCVVMLSNLSYKANIDNIIEFFQDYNLSPEQIIRRFNDNG